MSLISLMKKVLPHNLQRYLGVHGIGLIAKSGIAMSLFSQLADSRSLGLEVLPNGLCARNIEGRSIVCHRDGFRVFHEIFDTRPYEKYWSPQQGNTVLDLGAYVGMFSYRASLLVGNSGMVVSVEPDNDNYEMLTLNLKELPNTTIIQAAIGEYDGVIDLYRSPKSTCHNTVDSSTGNAVQVRATTIDSLVQQLHLSRVDFIKADIEGAEMRALYGATNTLRNNNVKIVIESYHRSPYKNNSERIAEFLRALGYSVILEKEYIYAQKGG